MLMQVLVKNFYETVYTLIRRSLPLKGGFSIVEVMAVIVIISILGLLGISRYYAFIAKGRQAEARINLKMIADLQETYKYEKEKFNALPSSKGVGAIGTSNKCGTTTAGEQMKNELGFRPKHCGELRYGYWWDTTNGHAKSRNSGNKLIYPGCAQFDQWTLTNTTGAIKNTNVGGDDHNVVKKCAE